MANFDQQLSSCDEARAIAARAAIYELACVYARAIDRRDFELLRRVFTEDACQRLPYLDVVCDGRENIVAVIEQIKAFEVTMHAVHNQLVELRDDGASAETYCTALHFWTDKRGQRYRYGMLIRYQDELVVQDERWRIRERALLLDEEWIDEMTPIPEGGPFAMMQQ